MGRIARQFSSAARSVGGIVSRVARRLFGSRTPYSATKIGEGGGRSAGNGSGAGG